MNEVAIKISIVQCFLLLVFFMCLYSIKWVVLYREDSAKLQKQCKMLENILPSNKYFIELQDLNHSTKKNILFLYNFLFLYLIKFFLLPSS